MDDLRFLGLDWDNHPVYQSDRDAFYQGILERLSAQGLTYPCYCSRRELHGGVSEASAPHGGPVLYSGRCRTLSPAEEEVLAAQGRRPSLRARVPAAEYSLTDGLQGPYGGRLDTLCGDFILRRSDGLYAYQLAVVADDGAMGVTQVVRGRDLLPSAPQQLWLQDVLGLPHPEYYHVPLLTAPDGRRLSKREGDLSIQALSKRRTAPELIGQLAFWAGLLEKPVPISPQQLLPHFSWDKIPKENIVAAPF